MAKREKTSKPFNAPFAGLKLPEAAKKAPARLEAPRPLEHRATRKHDVEAELFLEAAGPVRPPPGRSTRAPPPPPRGAHEVQLPSEADESMARLAESVTGSGPLRSTGSDEVMEGAAPGFDERVVRRLRAGGFPRQGRVDLHGLGRDEARAALESFIARSRVAGWRCVLVVHGRGLHSEAGVPVLKQGVQQWLTRGPVARHVLAFCSARPEDGGAGAVYVLLRR